MELVLATFNQNKALELQELFKNAISDISVHSLSDCGIREIAPETGDDFTANACQKALFYSSRLPEQFILAEDSGLMVQVLNGAPGVYSARYAHDQATDEENIDKLLKEMKKKRVRNAEFVSALALAKNEKIICSFHGRVAGEITMAKQGRCGFGYDPIFYYPPLNCTFAELSLEQKNSISHRRQSFNQCLDYLIELLQKPADSLSGAKQ
jgi:XTP/dITP diphosphohydrolase